MKLKFTILLILNTLALVAITYFFLYETDHGAKKIIIAALVAGISCFILLFFLLYVKSLNLPAKNGNLENNNKES